MKRGSNKSQQSTDVDRRQVVEYLEKKTKDLFNLMYNTDVPLTALDKEVMPYIDENAGFKDPWQEGRGKAGYREGLRGFHCQFYFDCDLFQNHVALNEDMTMGRAIFDGVMNIRSLSWLFTYPLRCIIVLHFNIRKINSDGTVDFRIRDHEEMWSFGDMIEAMPLIGKVYKYGFRRLFSRAFVLACRASEYFQTIRGTDVITGRNWNRQELLKEADLGAPSYALPNLFEI
eukprot:TRINITY_DN17783_c0_g1_i1.p1 TRINITY_DN17783_c0_g1~~TRINITY_DN17783_c0_g1_i1.p1  ORF type:complete len:230 (+),score=55.23 TRINITY_DN17783_c0_g1_i1:71-760(+)